jgi:hypothetical protein
MNIVNKIKKAFTKKEEAIPPTPRRYNPTDIEAAIVVLKEVKIQLEGNPNPVNLQHVSDEIFLRLPVEIRDADTKVNRAEFAAAIQSGAVFMHRMMKWMETP